MSGASGRRPNLVSAPARSLFPSFAAVPLSAWLVGGGKKDRERQSLVQNSVVFAGGNLRFLSELFLPSPSPTTGAGRHMICIRF